MRGDRAVGFLCQCNTVPQKILAASVDLHRKNYTLQAFAGMRFGLGHELSSLVKSFSAGLLVPVEF